jgi:ABC-type transport system substrate-binding protein
MTVTRRELLRWSGATVGGAALTSIVRPTGVWPSCVAQAVAAGPKATGGFVVAQSSEYHEINPHRELWSDDSSFHFAIFDSLVQRDDTMKLIPVLAESYQNISPLEWLLRCVAE